jgi:hypothetical protein
MPLASIAARVGASGSVMRIVISVPPAPSGANVVSTWLSGVVSGKCIRSTCTSRVYGTISMHSPVSENPLPLPSAHA